MKYYVLKPRISGNFAFKRINIPCMIKQNLSALGDVSYWTNRNTIHTMQHKIVKGIKAVVELICYWIQR